MSLKGIDISNYQAKMNVASVDADFVIIKSTQNNNFTSSTFVNQYNAAKKAGKLLGVYHYIGGAGVDKEANYFVKSLKSVNALGEAIICLDWESGQNSQWGNVTYLKNLADKVKSLTNQQIFIYTSKSVTTSLSSLQQAGYPLWGAEYASNNIMYYQTSPWDNGKSWGKWGNPPTIRQYSGNGRVTGYSGAVDLNIFYGTKEDWKKYASPLTNSTVKKETTTVNNMTKREVAVEIMRHLVTHDGNGGHGYSQYNRWGDGTYETITIGGKAYKIANGDRDCSSAVCDAYQTAGIPVRDKGATYTGNMKNAFLATGSFKWHNMSDGYVNRMKPGDVLLNIVHHTAMYMGNGQIAQFSISELGKVYGSKGDQTKGESVIKAYYNYPWDGILECTDNSAAAGTSTSGSSSSSITTPTSSTKLTTKQVQTMLNSMGWSLAVDGSFGPATKAAVKEFQQMYGLDVDGSVGSATTYVLEQVDAIVKDGFDAVYYSNTYADLKKAFGTDKKKLLNHYYMHGKKEGRKYKNTSSTSTNTTNNSNTLTVNTTGKYSTTPKRTGEITANRLNIRKGAGTSYANLTSYPVLNKGNKVDVCDIALATDKSKWYYIRINGPQGYKFGFASAEWIKLL